VLYIVNFTETSVTFQAFEEKADGETALAEAERGVTKIVESEKDLMDFDRAQLVRAYNALAVPGETPLHVFKTRTVAAERVWDRMIRVQPTPATVTPATVTPLAVAAPAPAAPKAPRAPRAQGKPAAAIGHPVRAGSKNAAIAAALLRGATLDEIAGPATYPRDAIQARIWGFWSATGIGYSVSPVGVYTAVLPVNLTAETAIKGTRQAHPAPVLTVVAGGKAAKAAKASPAVRKAA